MQFYLQDIAKNPLLAKVLAARVEIGEIEKSIDESIQENFKLKEEFLTLKKSVALLMRNSQS